MNLARLSVLSASLTFAACGGSDDSAASEDEICDKVWGIS